MAAMVVQPVVAIPSGWQQRNHMQQKIPLAWLAVEQMYSTANQLECFACPWLLRLSQEKGTVQEGDWDKQ